MGRPKALLDFGGRSALARVAEAGALGGAEALVVVVGPHEKEIREAHPAETLPPGARWAVNDVPGSEQLASLQLGLRTLADLEFDGFFLHPVDYPLVTADDYRRLTQAAAESATDADVFFLSHNGRRGHPVLCRAQLATSLLALGPEATARDVLGACPAAYVTTSNEGVLEDMDTPEDYARLLKRFQSQ